MMNMPYSKYIIALFAIVLASILVYSLSNHPATSQHYTSPQSYSANSTAIVPGSAPVFTCTLQTQHPIPVNIINYSGFTSNIIENITDYVLPPGRAGYISYGIPYGVTDANASAISNLTTFYHRVQFIANYTITEQNVSGSAPQYNVCYELPSNGTVCFTTNSTPSQDYRILNVSSTTHPGINVKSTAPSQSGSGEWYYAILNLSVNQSAPEGTYWVAIGGSQCSGGQLALITIGNSGYLGPVVWRIYS